VNRLLDRLISRAGVTSVPVACVLALVLTGTARAGGTHSAHEVPQLLAQPKTTVTYEGNRVTVTFGPVDLPSGHDGELAASLLKHVFGLPEDMTMVGYQSRVFTKDGVELPRQYLHHILLINQDKDSVSCPGEPLFFAGAGLEMTEARFPSGYGVKLAKGQKLMAIVAFYHGVPPTMVLGQVAADLLVSHVKKINESALEVGDVILTTTNLPISKGIRAATKGEISHAMIYVQSYSVIDATSDGVQARNTQRMFIEDNCAVHVLRLI
jgi:hypothetical protein